MPALQLPSEVEAVLNKFLAAEVTTVNKAGQPLTWDDLLSALDHIRKQAKKLCDDGKDITALARLLRAS